jgi:hypothetical protein
MTSDMKDAQHQRARALARWEGEGGSLGASANVKDGLDDVEIRILARIGAAVLTEWDQIPEARQRALTLRAAGPWNPADIRQLKSRIAGVVHDHEKGKDSP